MIKEKRKLNYNYKHLEKQHSSWRSFIIITGKVYNGWLGMKEYFKIKFGAVRKDGCTWRFKELGGGLMEDTLLQNPRTVLWCADWSPSRSWGEALEESPWIEQLTDSLETCWVKLPWTRATGSWTCWCAGTVAALHRNSLSTPSYIPFQPQKRQ